MATNPNRGGTVYFSAWESGEKMKYFWALLLFLLGVIFLGAEFGYWGYDQVNQIWQFWPLILVFAGLDLLTNRYKYGWLLMLVAFFLSAGFIYTTIFTNYNLLGIKGGNQKEVTTSQIKIDIRDEIKEQELLISTGAMNLNISGETDHLIEGELKSDIMKPNVKISYEGSVAQTEINTEGIDRMWFGVFGFKNELNLSLNREIPLSLALKMGAASMNLDLSKYKLQALSIDAGASSIDLRLGEVMGTDFVIDTKTGASSIKISIPQDYNVRVESESALSSVDKPDDINNPKATIVIKLSSAATSVGIVRY
jgi:hypothetical protein